jgi:hypothetical protein
MKMEIREPRSRQYVRTLEQMNALDVVDPVGM